jgi:hypothetical protein
MSPQIITVAHSSVGCCLRMDRFNNHIYKCLASEEYRPHHSPRGTSYHHRFRRTDRPGKFQDRRPRSGMEGDNQTAVDMAFRLGSSVETTEAYLRYCFLCRMNRLTLPEGFSNCLTWVAECKRLSGTTVLQIFCTGRAGDPFRPPGGRRGSQVGVSVLTLCPSPVQRSRWQWRTSGNSSRDADQRMRYRQTGNLKEPSC